jgi:hypothetical protein
MHERVRQEIELLRQKYPQLQYGEKLEWIHILDFLLPTDRYNLERSPVAFLIPAGYPNTGPDNFFADSGLKLKSGANPPNFNLGVASSAGQLALSGNWGWFSWHPKIWRPSDKIESGDNLLTFVRSIQMCLRGEDSP